MPVFPRSQLNAPKDGDAQTPAGLHRLLHTIQCVMVCDS